MYSCQPLIIPELDSEIVSQCCSLGPRVKLIVFVRLHCSDRLFQPLTYKLAAASLLFLSWCAPPPVLICSWLDHLSDPVHSLALQSLAFVSFRTVKQSVKRGKN